ncbi:MAG: hypothetical protein CM15mP88_1830 [Pseudomonadota bacterium]|nr:MAG: hypothetical protein CM15mP88_1830 [Pseudomonadota bacterium]
MLGVEGYQSVSFESFTPYKGYNFPYHLKNLDRNQNAL